MNAQTWAKELHFRDWPKIEYDKKKKMLKAQLVTDSSVTLYHPFEDHLDGSQRTYYRRRLTGAYARIQSESDHQGQVLQEGVCFMVQMRYFTGKGENTYPRITFPRRDRKSWNEIQYYPHFWYTEAALYMHVYNLV